MEKTIPSFLKTLASACYSSGNRWLRNKQASTPPFTDVHGPLLHKGTSKHEDLFDSLNVCVCKYYTLSWSKYRPNSVKL